jgi:O-antigen ligase
MRPPTTAARAREPLGRRLSTWIVCAFALLIPLGISLSGADSFRIPKEVLLHAEGLLLLVVAVWTRQDEELLAIGRTAWRKPLLLAAAAVLWTAVGTLLSTNRTLSAITLLLVTLSAVVFCGTLLVVRRAGRHVIWFALVPAAINAVLVVLQAAHIWSPFTLPADAPSLLHRSALIGNPDDVGSYLLAPFLASLALAFASTGRRRWLLVAFSLVLLSGMLATQTLTPLIAGASGVVTMAAVASWRRALIATLLVALALMAMAVVLPPIRARVMGIRDMAAAHRYNEVLSGRLTPAFAAMQMAREHPLLGVGPGAFRYHYFDEKMKVEMRYPDLLRNNPLNFGQAHNEHLQLLAEGGPVAYAIFLAALLLLAMQTGAATEAAARATTPATVEAARFRRFLSLPLAVTVFVMCLAHFPLRLAASLSVLLFLGALCLAWGTEDAA